MSRLRGALLAAAVLLIVGLFVGVQQGSPGGRGAGSTATDPAPSVQSMPAAATERAGGLPPVARSVLPPEARATLDLIAVGGPFPYDQDGATFQNRERLLPIRPAGTYREYTVETPGSPDRGARRIVTASTGESYWTADHYASFARILP